MYSLNCFQHNTCSKDLCKKYGTCSFASRLAYFYTKPLLAGENVAVGFTSPTSAMNAYLMSPGHCVNIVYPGFTEIGNTNIKNWWQSDFGGGGPDTNSGIVMAHHFVNLDGSITFYQIYSDRVNKVAPQAPIICLNGDKCHTMTPVLQFTNLPKHAAVWQWIAPVSNLKQLKTTNGCFDYVVFSYYNNSHYIRYPQSGTLYTYGHGGCTMTSGV